MNENTDHNESVCTAAFTFMKTVQNENVINDDHVILIFPCTKVTKLSKSAIINGALAVSSMQTWQWYYIHTLHCIS
jgi:hypothetical protein